MMISKFSTQSILVAILMVVALTLTACGSAPKTSKKGDTVFSAPAAGNGTQLRPYGEKTLANGLRVLYVEDNSLPYVSLSLLLKTGAASDSAAFPGLSLFVAEMLDKGTAQRSATEIADEFGRIGADFSAGATPDSTAISASSLSMHADRMIALFAEVIMQPTFTESEVTRMRKQILSAIQKRVDNPESLTETAWDDFLFANHPYARPLLGTTRSIQAVKRKHVIQHYLRQYRPNNAILAVTGKLSPEMMAKVEQTFSSWEPRDVPELVYPAFPAIEKIQIRLVDNPALVQAQIRIGHKGIRRKNEDFIALRVMNTILGGAFSSRLMDKIRKEKGLTYSISSSFDARMDHGPFDISTFTKNESTGLTITEILKVLETFRKGGVTDEEVKRAKGYLKGVFPT
ncbi:MAG: insulinase family protein, partial [Bdellovibrionaceae bacterium]|nr:insulinase family protein [Pseudobdellovibrionaceae bacterium]